MAGRPASPSSDWFRSRPPYARGPAAGPVDGQEILVFAAASTGTALQEIANAYAAVGGGRVRFSLAATSALARQIESGAPADLFVSANTAWMDAIDEAELLAAGSRTLLFRNRLVLVAPSDTDMGPVAVTSRWISKPCWTAVDWPRRSRFGSCRDLCAAGPGITRNVGPAPGACRSSQ